MDDAIYQDFSHFLTFRLSQLSFAHFKQKDKNWFVEPPWNRNPEVSIQQQENVAFSPENITEKAATPCRERTELVNIG